MRLRCVIWNGKPFVIWKAYGFRNNQARKEYTHNL